MIILSYKGLNFAAIIFIHLKSLISIDKRYLGVWLWFKFKFESFNFTNFKERPIWKIYN